MNRHASWLMAAVFAGLAGCSSGNPPAESAAATSDRGVGARIFRGNCIGCHQSSGFGIPGLYPSLAGSPVVLGDPVPLALWVVKGRRPPGMPVGRFPAVMPKFVWLKPEDVAALLTYLRAEFGNSAAPVTAASVTQALNE